MTWAMTLDVPAPPEAYDAVHRRLLETVGTSVDGLVLHLTRATPTGFQVTEVWESREQYERYERGPVAAARKLLGGGGDEPEPGAPAEFAVRGLVIPAGGIAI